MLHTRKQNTTFRLLVTAVILSLSNLQFAVLESAASPAPSTTGASQASDASAPQTPGNLEQNPLTDGLSVSEQRTVVDGLSKVLRANYLYPDKAEKMAEELERFSTEVLVEPIDAHDLASHLTEKLYELSNDLHFFVGLDEDWIAEQSLLDNPEGKRELREKERQHEEQQNFFFKELKILEGNVGYLSFSRFADPELGHQTLATSMTFLSHCDAFIIDLRNNNGGVLEMAQLLASYFLSSETDQPLFDYYYFEDGRKIERKHWVLPSVPGQRQLDAPLYILVSTTSFSAAEWFAFALRALGRAEVIGEQTAGGAHPVDRKAIDHRFIVNVPIGAIKGPGGARDFEAVGVKPDEAIAAHEALDLAHQRALETLMAQDNESRNSYEWLLPIIEARRQPVNLDAARIDAFIGDFSGRTILTENGALYYTWNGKSKIRLTPLSPSLFALEGIDDFRIRFIESEGQVTALERVYADGRAPKVRRRTGNMEK